MNLEKVYNWILDKNYLAYVVCEIKSKYDIEYENITETIYWYKRS